MHVVGWLALFICITHACSWMISAFHLYYTCIWLDDHRSSSVLQTTFWGGERGRGVTEHKICFDFLYKFIWKMSDSEKNSPSYCHKSENVFTQSISHSCQILMKLEFSQQISETSSNIKFHEKPSSGSRVVPCWQTYGWTDRHEEANSRYSQFCKRAQKWLAKRKITCVQHFVTTQLRFNQENVPSSNIQVF